ncbi:MAG: pyridoxal phosphate-dependent aminotransferase, partial [Ilumatobacteraceae bacterium]
RQGHTRYTDVTGIDTLKQAIAETYRQQHQLDVAIDEVIVSNGAKQVIFNAIMALVGPGDEVVIPTPAWVSYSQMVSFAGGRPVLVPACLDDSFAPDPARLAQAMSRKTKVIILNSPCNPTGAIATTDTVDAICALIDRHPDVMLVCDDVYEHIRFTRDPPPHPLQRAPELRQRVVAVNSVSKAHAMTGWRIGWGVGARDIVTAMARIQSQSTSNANSIAQHAAVAALTGPQHHLATRAETYRRRRDLALDILAATQRVHCPTPDGAFYLYLAAASVLGARTSSDAIINNDIDLVDYLVDHGVATVPGSAFGWSPAFRISTAIDDRTLRTGCERIVQAIEQLDCNDT